ncbi:MAG TPA: efflux RND transporter periplasmic adaptor subunit [Stellaceae bacterium]|nr:efflux RND transporter periplasmic adaptor subunit [Stellaceae bacterium]
MSVNRPLVIAGAAGAVIATAISFVAATGHPAQPTARPAVPVRVAAVHLEPAGRTARYAAVIQPRIEASVGFRVAGKLARRLVEVGDRVEPGTVLAQLDPADLQLQETASAAQLVSAQADAANARHDFERYAKLRQGEWTTQQEYDKRKAAMDTAAARVAQAEAERRIAGNNADYAALTADSAGVVTAVLAEPGQVLSAGQPVFKIARLGEMEAVADVPEQETPALRTADLTVELWSLPGVAVRGHLRELAPSADADTRTYRAKITLDDPPPMVRLGMTATLVECNPEPGMVAVLPAAALASHDAAPAVFVLNPAGDGLELRPVRVAAYAGEHVVVAGGIAEGDRVVTAGVQKLDTGEKVRAWSEPVR